MMRILFSLAVLWEADAARVNRAHTKSSNTTIATDDMKEEVYNQPPSTIKGCQCTSECGVTFAGYCYAQPWCYVKDEACATKDGSAQKAHSMGFGTYYDYCTFEKYEPYEKLTAEVKSQILLQRILQDKESGTYPSPLGVLEGIVSESVKVSFDASADVFPQDDKHPRKKFIHSVGVVAPISFESKGDHKYTGLFTGAEYGFMRLSSAKCPSSSGGIIPGAAIKLLRNGKPSANFVVMYSLDGQKCEDGKSKFFGNDWHNHIQNSADFGLGLLAKKFWQASYCPNMVGLSDVAATEGSEAIFPYMLTLRRAKDPDFVDLDFPCDDLSTGLDNFGNIKVNKTLFEVLATDAPGGTATKIGEFVLRGQFTTSKFGDETMFFKHQYMEDDFKLREGWLTDKNFDAKKDCGMTGVSASPPDISKGCSNPFKG